MCQNGILNKLKNRFIFNVHWKFWFFAIPSCISSPTYSAQMLKYFAHKYKYAQNVNFKLLHVSTSSADFFFHLIQHLLYITHHKCIIVPNLLLTMTTLRGNKAKVWLNKPITYNKPYNLQQLLRWPDSLDIWTHT